MISGRGVEDELARHVVQQAAVVHLGQAALAGAEPAALMQQAVELVAGTLGVEFASVLELEPDGKALIVRAGVGWKEGRVGRSTVGADDRSLAGYTLLRAEPVVVEDLGSETRFARDPRLFEYGVQSAVGVPVSGDAYGRPFGVLSAMSTAARRFGADDVQFLQTIGNILATAVERRRDETELEEARNRLAFLAEASAILAGSLDYETTLASVARLAVPRVADWCVIHLLNEDGSFRQIEVAHTDPSLEDLVHGLQERYPDDPKEDHPRRRVVRTGEPELMHEVPDELLRRVAQDEEHLRILRELGFRSAMIVPLLARGRTLGTLSLVSAESGRLYEAPDLELASDLAGRVALAVDNAGLYGEVRAGRDRLAFLAGIAPALHAATLDYETLLQRVAELCVPVLADWCYVDVVDDEGSIARLAVAHADPSEHEEAQKLRARPPDERGEHLALEVLRSGRSILTPGPPEAIVVPLAARGRTLGVLTLVGAPGRRYGRHDLVLAEEVAQRAAFAVDNARLYRDRSEVARVLQTSLLPPSLPDIPGIDVAARYHASSGEDSEVGGDFYDVFDTGREDWGVVVGDVCGKGADAAVITSLARHTLRTAALRSAAPKEILLTLNEAILRSGLEGRFCTAVYACVYPSRRRARLSVCPAGHPLPLVLRGDGRIEAVGRPGTLLGAFPDADLAEETVELRPGDAIVMYTDGVTEARGPTSNLGEGMVRYMMESCAGQGARIVADRVAQGALDFQRGQAHDDIAVLALAVPR